MEDRIIKATSFTPLIELKGSLGVISITGRSTPENALDFYRPILRWVADYVNEAKQPTTLNFQLDYFNSSSSKCILDLIRTVAKLQASGVDVTVNWFYQSEDVDMRDTGLDLQSLANIQFNVSAI